MSCVRACMRGFEYVRSLSACVCLVACFVIVCSEYMYNNLLYCTRFDSIVCSEVWCSSQTR